MAVIWVCLIWGIFGDPQCPQCRNFDSEYFDNSSPIHSSTLPPRTFPCPPMTVDEPCRLRDPANHPLRLFDMARHNNRYSFSRTPPPLQNPSSPTDIPILLLLTFSDHCTSPRPWSATPNFPSDNSVETTPLT